MGQARAEQPKMAPSCVSLKINELFPDSDYVGFKEEYDDDIGEGGQGDAKQ